MAKYQVGDLVWYRIEDKKRIGKIEHVDEVIPCDVSYYIKSISSSLIEPQWFSENKILGLSYRPKCISSTADSCDFLFCNFPGIKKVIFNNPATIVFWRDGTKTVVKTRAIKTVEIASEVYFRLTASDIAKFIRLKSGQRYKATYKGETNSFLIDIYDEFDPEKGLAMAIAKKALGNNYNYYNKFKKWLPKEE